MLSVQFSESGEVDTAVQSPQPLWYITLVSANKVLCAPDQFPSSASTPGQLLTCFLSQRYYF